MAKPDFVPVDVSIAQQFVYVKVVGATGRASGPGWGDVVSSLLPSAKHVPTVPTERVEIGPEGLFGRADDVLAVEVR